MKLLGIETSCDETGIAVIENGRQIHSNLVASQIDIHAEYGGVVPEIAARQHLLTFNAVVKQALKDAELELHHLDGIAVTHGPGLAGPLLVGVNAAKGLALAENLPLVGINHLEGHIYAAWLEDIPDPEVNPGFPLLCLIASGGHTDLILMEDHGRYQLLAETRDDAAGETFDKAARILGLGFPGGPAIQKMAEHPHSPEAKLPRPRVKGSNDFSFSGLKTAVLHRAQEKGWYPPTDCDIDQNELAGVAAELQEAIVDSIISRVVTASKQHHVKGVVLGGGVAANSLLRSETTKHSPVEVIMPRPVLCTDNGAMIGAAGWFHLRNSAKHQWDMDVVPGLRLA
ncbi:MAG: tRNA (adenosine(37)-N6)-threonylcarbamoyltransferase complex transferase subunit TsaD [SAR202 cluster bacterium]|nr:tRNA (adenosine(37)-N6)-threonylcarbamoyltransferase complex transferase subunit TsaD [SAR202 cluster bacterium]